MWTIRLCLLAVTQSSSAIDMANCIDDIFSRIAFYGDYVTILNQNHPNYAPHDLLPPPVDQHTKLMERLMRSQRYSIFSLTNSMKPLTAGSLSRIPHTQIIIISLVIFQENDFVNILEIIRSYRINHSHCKLIILLECNDSDVTDEIFGIVWRYTKSYFTLILCADRDMVNIITYNPYAGQLKGKLINSWNNGFENNFLFFGIPQNLSAVVLKIITIENFPYTSINVDSGQPNGLEITLVDTIAEHLGVTISYQVPSFGENNDILMNDGKFSGTYGMLYNNTIDLVCAGTTLTDTRASAVAVLPPTWIDDSVYLVPNPSAVPNWKNLFGAFNKSVWYLILATGFVCLFLLNIGSHKQERNPPMDSLFIFIMQLLEQGSPKRVIESYYRPLLLSIIYFSFITSVFYKSVFTSTMTVPYKPSQLSNIAEAYEAGLHFCFRPTAQPFLKNVLGSLYEKISDSGQLCFEDNITVTHYKIGVERSSLTLSYRKTYPLLYNFYFGKYGGDTLVVHLTERHMLLPFYLLLSPAHPLFTKIQDTQLRLADGGLLEYWLVSLLDKYKRMGILQQRSTTKALTLSEFSVIFQLLLYINCFNWIILACELMYDKMTHRIVLVPD